MVQSDAPTLSIQFGRENFLNYRRLSYKWWYALAEFIDNSTQSYFDNRAVLDERFGQESDRFRVSVVADNREGFIRVTDNAMGMDLPALRRALIVGVPPENHAGRCRYGLGMKTAACWIGNDWVIRTTKLGDINEYTVNISVPVISREDGDPTVLVRPAPAEAHYTVLEITNHNRPLRGRTIGKVKQYLGSIYRQDLRNNLMVLTYNDEPLEGIAHPDTEFLPRVDGTRWKNTFIFEIENLAEPANEAKVVKGWVGVLESGSRSRAGFSILHRNRVICGWPDSWRPESIYGPGGRNDLINQRVVGEINLEDFEVSHTKDEVNWYGEEEELVEVKLKQVCAPFLEAARRHRKGTDAGHGPTTLEVDSALREIEEEITSPEFLERLQLVDMLPPEEQLEHSNEEVVVRATEQEPVITALVAGLTVHVYLNTVGSSYDPYLITEGKDESTLLIIVNRCHPHWSMLEGAAVANYLRHCVYDGIAEHRAIALSRLDPDSIKWLKDGLLRVGFAVVQRVNPAEVEEEAAASEANLD